MFEDLHNLPLDPWADALVVVVALAQLALARRADTGPVSLAVAGAVAWLHAPDTPIRATVFAVSAWLAALAWTRAARRGVGRPELTGLVVATWVTVVSVDAVSADLGLPATWARGGGLGVLVLMAGVCAVMAWERRGLYGQRVYHYRDVPIERGTPAAPATDDGSAGLG